MKQVIIKEGSGLVVEVPAPQEQMGKILVKNHYSCISPGTEMQSISNTSKPLWKRALENPSDVKKVIKAVSNQGLGKTTQVVEGQLSAGNEVGYSSSGVVLSVPNDIKDFKVGDHVACAGTGYAIHADIVSIPENLLVKIPKDQNLAEASSVALGAIAMQGVRRANPILGEIFVVFGLGILGQITTQLLLNNGCKVIGIDIDEKRGQIAINYGMNHFINGDEIYVCDQVKRISDGVGADGVIITAASSSNQIVSDSFKMSRKRGRVVLVGSVGLELNRADFYKDEIDFKISASYGPGRYDSNYEEKGIDYPIGYVRWTEKRNMKLYLDLLRRGNLKLENLINDIIEVEDAHTAYEQFSNKEIKPLMLLLKYSTDVPELKNLAFDNIQFSNKNKGIKNGSKVSLSLIGAGGFAKGMHLPNLKKLNNKYEFQTIVDYSGNNAQNTAKQYQFNSYDTNAERLFNDPKTDAILVATRHNTHGKFVLESIKAGKHVLVEKPMVLNQQELDDIKEFYKKNKEDAPIVLTGFNRRFSKYIQKVKKEVANRSNPMIINYRMNAGYQPLNLWYHQEEGGGRNLGEACHIYDIFTFLTGAEIENVEAYSINPTTEHYSSKDNFTALLKFSDGSIATLTYTAMGNSKHPKELMEVYVDGKVIKLEDYKSMLIMGKNTKKVTSKLPEKGHFEELDVFATAIINKQEWPIPLWQQVQAMQIALDVDKCLTK
jgi:predicted dehydrogenase/threonine dehydrogenase-like Zn-dependent dehydrogenase